MDYALAIRRNRDQLKGIVLALFALAGGLTSPRRGEVSPKATERGFPLFLPRSTLAAIMLVLRPAESAVRRLIVIAAHGLKPITTSGLAKQPGGWLLLSPTERGGEVPSACEAVRGSYRAFALFDPLKSFDPDSFWDAEPIYESGYNLAKSATWHDASIDHTPINAIHLGHRLNALLRALNNLPRQARRLKRWEAKRDAVLRSLMLRCEQREPRSMHTWHPRRLSPMRPGLPPGWRQRKLHEIDPILKECHGLAHDRLNSS